MTRSQGAIRLARLLGCADGGHPEVDLAGDSGEPERVGALVAQCKRIFSEKISTRVKVRPELEEALKLAYDIKEAAPTSRSSSPSTSSGASPATPPS